jgi:hypothetical protein
LRQTGEGLQFFQLAARLLPSRPELSSLFCFEHVLALSDGAWALLDSVTSTFFEKRVESSSIALAVE